MRALLAVAAFATLPALPALDAQRLTEPLVFASERHGNTDLYLSDGGTLQRLTQDPAADELPRCSPDGRYIAFRRGGVDGGEIYRLDRRTGEELRLTNDQVRDSTPAWSADGRQIYFTKRTGKHDRVAVMNADGSNVRFLTGDDWHNTHPGVSPDGREIVHHTYRYGGDTELQVITLESGASRRLTNTPGYDYEPSFAGPGRVIFSSNRDGDHYRLYVFDMASGSTRLLADAGADAWASRYSPVSNSVIFNAGKPGAWRLFQVGIDGGTPLRILDDGFSNHTGAWCARLN
jgi:Tol biopolymer transport system component